MKKTVLSLMLMSVAGVAAAQEVVLYFPGAASATVEFTADAHGDGQSSDGDRGHLHPGPK